MQFFSKTMLALSLLGSLASSSPIATPSLVTRAISETSLIPHATHGVGHNDTHPAAHRVGYHCTHHTTHKGGHRCTHHATHKCGPHCPHHAKHDYVGHSDNEKALTLQHGMAMELVPVSNVCTGHEYCEKNIQDKKFLSGDLNKALKNVTVSMEQVEASPLIIRVTVTNNSTGPITFWKDLSPLSSYALDLGYFHVQSGIDGVKFGERTRAEAHGYRPDSYSDLIEVGAGAWARTNITLPRDTDTPEAETWLKMLEMGGNATVRMSGNWYGIWAASKEKVMATDMEYSQYGFNFWNDLYIPWEATFSEESAKYSPVWGMGLYLE
ncbi:uncharacterized protein BKA55DRAFT_687259 [Fusarium redolens]|uniref:Uncharacterized protein n=1 Tax=Fusarium redolens TaxID=48865 RepID=A0A9P9HJY5_FUSRE|nr:uncharacterized protein BKA55DRAFT_687259 [Fusarium redolens]KAH7258970.1 hypothetical protein BKA55DRAFT_687259 [Fusarium redolens]